jgi:hypothetical protein
MRAKTQTMPLSISNGRRHPARQPGRLSSAVLTSQLDLIDMQRQLKGLLKENFEFYSARNGTRVVVKEMVDSSTMHYHFKSSNLPYFTCYPKYQKPIKAVILKGIQ